MAFPSVLSVPSVDSIHPLKPLKSLKLFCRSLARLQHVEDFFFKRLDLGIDLGELARGFVPVEQAVERYFVSDLGFAFVDPRVGDMRQDFTFEVRGNVLFKRDVLGVAEVGIGFGASLGIAAYLGRLVLFAKGFKNRLLLRRGEIELRLLVGSVEFLAEHRAILEDLVLCLLPEFMQHREDRLLAFLALVNVLLLRLPFLLLADRQIRKAADVGEAGNAGFLGREVQAQRTLDGDLAVPEVGVVENLRDDSRPRLAVAGRGARGIVFELAEDLRELLDVGMLFRFVYVAEQMALVAEALRHLVPEVAGVDELDSATALLFLPVRQNPDVGGNAGVVEKLVGQGDNRLQPVVLDDPLADVGFAAPGVARKQRRAVEDDAQTGSAFIDGPHLRNHVLEKEQRAVVDPRESCAEASGIAELLRFAPDEFLLLLPFDAKRRIREHVVEAILPEAVVHERAAELDVVHVLALDEHVGTAGGIRLVVQILPIEHRHGVAVEGADVFLGNGEHAAGSAGGVVDGLDDVALVEVMFGAEQEVDHEADDLARREMLSGLFVRLFGADQDKFLEDIAHLQIGDGLGGEIDLIGGESLDHVEEEVFFVHLGDLHPEVEAFEDVPHVGGEGVYVAREVLGELIGVVEQFFEREGRCVVERNARDLVQLGRHNHLGFARQFFELGQNLVLCGLQHGVEPAEHGQRQNDLAVLVALIRPSEKVADAPDEIRDIFMRLM